MHLCGDRDFWRLWQCAIHRNSQRDTHGSHARWPTTIVSTTRSLPSDGRKRGNMGIEMLHARAFQRALEGDLEPIYYMGVVVGYIRKFDTKLQIEMLRAYK